jgi:hypothetical protein
MDFSDGKPVEFSHPTESRHILACLLLESESRSVNPAFEARRQEATDEESEELARPQAELKTRSGG